MHSELLLDITPFALAATGFFWPWISYSWNVGHCTVSATFRESHLLSEYPMSQSMSIHSFQLLVLYSIYVCSHASFIIFVDMWTLEGFDKSRNIRAGFMLQQISDFCSRCMDWQFKRLIHQNDWEKNSFSTF